MRARLASATASLVLLSACAGSERTTTAAGWRGTIDTLPNGAILVRNPAEGIWDSVSAWRIVEELRIGSEDSDGPDMFGRIADIGVDDLGRIFVLDGQAAEIRVFDSTGAHVRTIGRKGAGPGEFRNPTGVRVRGDGTFWVIDPSNARFTLFDSAGMLRRTARRVSSSSMSPWGGFVDSLGNLAEHTHVLSRAGEFLPAMVRYDSMGVARDTVELPDVRVESFTVTRNGGTETISAQIPFVPVSVLHLDRRGFLWFGVSDRYRIEQRRFEGDAVRVFERDVAPRPVRDQEIDEYVKSMDVFTRKGGTIDRGHIPSVHPLFTAMFVDDAGYLWVLPDGSRAERGFAHEVFDPEGRYLGRVRSRMRFGWRQPVVRGNRLYTVLADSLGVESVVRARVVRGGGR
jgi:hypothetical protein